MAMILRRCCGYGGRRRCHPVVLPKAVGYYNLYRQLRPASSWTVDPNSGLVTTKSSSTKGTATTKYQVVVGLEVHAQLNIPTKLFSDAPTQQSFSSSSTSLAAAAVAVPANTRVRPFDIAVPGILPVLSKEAVQKAVLAAAALQCHAIPKISRFERKHYAYADLPHGYQITQQRWPIAQNGIIECSPVDNEKKKKSKKKQPNDDNKSKSIQCRVNRLQLEIDTGKTTTTTTTTRTTTTTTTGNSATGTASNSSQVLTLSHVDYNRAGIALLEIVTEPDLRSSTDTGILVTHLRQLLQHTNVCLGRMEHGQFRVDCNVNIVENDTGDASSSTRKKKSARVEVKNLNSIQQVRDAINYEAMRHAEMLDASSNDERSTAMTPETRTWNPVTRQTELIRRKDDEEDYRFMPEPDLPPIVLDRTIFDTTDDVVEFVAQNLPELPSQAIDRWMLEYDGLSTYQAHLMASDPPAIAFFDTAMSVVSDKDSASAVANMLCNILFSYVKRHCQKEGDEYMSVERSRVSAQQLGELVLMVKDETISNSMARKLLEILYTDDSCQGMSPRQVASERGFALIQDTAVLRQICENVIAQHPEELNVYRQGGKFVTKMRKLFTGKAMEACRGNAHPERLRELLDECLETAAASKVE